MRTSAWTWGLIGSILWPEATDKQRKAHLAPLSEEARRSVNRACLRRETGSPYLFPAAKDSRKPMGKREAQVWWIDCEKLAELEHIDRGGWHSLRRKWATERKHLPDVDVAAAGGWTPGSTLLKEIYQQADQAGDMAAVTDRRALRAVR